MLARPPSAAFFVNASNVVIDGLAPQFGKLLVKVVFYVALEYTIQPGKGES